MNKTIMRKTIIPLLLALCGSANASVVYQGVTFTTSSSGNTLTLRIDAAHPTGDWINAKEIGALEVHGIGKFTGVTLSSFNPSGAGAWTHSGQQLGNNGCAGGSQPDKVACFSGAHLTLQDDMLFTFTFGTPGTAFDLTDPSIKLNFFAQGGTTKVGNLFSQDVPNSPPPTDVPEPQSLALLAGGAAVMGALKRRRARKG